MGRARSPAAKHFDAVYTVKQPYKNFYSLLWCSKQRQYKIHIDV